MMSKSPGTNGAGSTAKFAIDVTGIWPESRSFDDVGYGPVPAQWRGTCQTGQEFNATGCKRKIIGAWWFTGGMSDEALKGDYMSLKDLGGHETHVALTIAGSRVPGASYGGLAAGVARGGAPRARLAIYKVLWGRRGRGSDAVILAAIDHAINDGVDVLSLSLGSAGTEIVRSLNAVQRGISVVFAAGNDGPVPQTVTNASRNVTGKIVLCYAPAATSITLPKDALSMAINRTIEAGVKGLIFAQYAVNSLGGLAACNGVMPHVLVDFELAHRILSYRDITENPVVKVSPTMSVVGNGVLSPRVASFSSRGPSPAFPGILKPDIAAPGVGILAAERNSYVFKSGTSVACPHVSAVTALLKSVHPDWSPAMIKSAIVTTGLYITKSFLVLVVASVTDRFGMPIQAEGVPRKLADPFDFGGGHMDPVRAVDPGLVYDADAKEYNKFFNCTLGLLKGCESYNLHLNLPSIIVPNLKEKVMVRRIVTNVGPSEATYRATLEAPTGVVIERKVIQDFIADTS
ncbi:hypothetical protein BRADI_3g10044v3 [Brachypodium distachyon]|uniref:Peptidase S8/S53 domain-containing protein n=1 Tax=Brachypodium distachyon TaxID=15368 RepID=A0A0Q3F810_BRADI|nr:hypothetical protein BRADI_3g10044v3 [Brachypodium distachyon]